LSADENEFQRTEQAGFTFLSTDLDLALTLARIASEAGDDVGKRARNQENARHAYDTILRLRQNLSLTDEQNGELNEKLEALKSALDALGERF
jgi:hypothetical protein